MLRNLAKSTLRPSMVRSFAAIPVHNVARVARFHVKDEEAAEAVDAELMLAFEGVRTAPGFQKLTRTVCKSEWAYEISVVFDAEHFGAYMESDLRKKELAPRLEKVLGEFSTSEVYQGNRVYDEHA